MRKYLEKEMLCEELANKIRYDCTTYAGIKEENKSLRGNRAYWDNYWNLLSQYPVTQRT